MENEDGKYDRARKVAKNKIGFIRHFIIYIFILIVLAIINNVTFRGYQWWLWVALFWGIGVFFNFVNAYFLKGGALKHLEDNLTKREVERMKNEK